MSAIPTILVLFALSASVTLDESNPDSASEYEMNETFTHEAFEYTFTDAYYTALDDILVPENTGFIGVPDTVFVVDFEYTNISNSPSSPIQYIRVYDDNPLVEGHSLLHHLPMINPSRSGQGQLVYTVPDGVEHLEIVIGTDLYVKSNNAIVNIVVDE